MTLWVILHTPNTARDLQDTIAKRNAICYLNEEYKTTCPLNYVCALILLYHHHAIHQITISKVGESGNESNTIHLISF